MVDFKFSFVEQNLLIKWYQIRIVIYFYNIVRVKWCIFHTFQYFIKIFFIDFILEFRKNDNKFYKLHIQKEKLSLKENIFNENYLLENSMQKTVHGDI